MKDFKIYRKLKILDDYFLYDLIIVVEVKFIRIINFL